MITTPSVLASLVLAGSLVANSVAAPLFPPIANLIPVSSSPVLAPAGDGTSSAAGSRQTPKGIPSSADLMDLSQLSKLFGATNRGNGLTPPQDPSMGLSPSKGPGVLLGEVPLGDTIGTAMKLVPAGQTIPPVTTPASLASSTNMTCLDSSFTDVEITSLFARTSSPFSQLSKRSDEIVVDRGRSRDYRLPVPQCSHSDDCRYHVLSARPGVDDARRSEGRFEGLGEGDWTNSVCCHLWVRLFSHWGVRWITDRL
jgi:hypothetical protein